MSLLLEALKKAEKAKEDAQRRAQEGEGTSELRLADDEAAAAAAKHVTTRDELPQITSPLEIHSDDIAADPAKGLDASIAAQPDLGKDRATQSAILRATIDDWSVPGGSPSTYGTIDRAGWQATIDYMTRLGMVPTAVTVDQVVLDIGAGG